VVAGNVDDASALCGPGAEASAPLVVGLGNTIPIEAYSVDDVARDKSRQASDREEILSSFRQAAFGAEMQIGQKKSPDARVPFFFFGEPARASALG